MNPEFVKAELEKLREKGFTEELIVSKHVDGRVSILTHLPGSVEYSNLIYAYSNGISLVTSIILSMSKMYAAPGQDRALLVMFMKHLAERVTHSKALHFQMGVQPTVEPGLSLGPDEENKD